MVVVVLGLRTAGQTLNSLTTTLERLCSKEDRTWKERLFNQTKLVMLHFEEHNMTVYFIFHDKKYVYML
jgi:hypothetical protein